MKTTRHSAVAIGLLSVFAVTAQSNRQCRAADPEYFVVAQTGQQAADTAPGVTYAYVHTASLNSDGRIAFLAGLAGPGITPAKNVAIWTGTIDQQVIVVQEGDSAAQAGPDIVFEQVLEPSNPSLTAPLLDEGGFVATVALVSGPGVDLNNRRSIWLWGESGMELIARAQAPAPDLPAGSRYSHMTGVSPVLNAGKIAFRTFFWNPSIPGTGGTAIWSGPPNSLQARAMTNAPAPGDPSGSTYETLYFDPTLNEQGQIAYCGQRREVGFPLITDAAWYGGPGDVYLLLRESDPLQIAGPGVLTSEFATPIAQNNNGNIAFPIKVTGTGVTALNDNLLLSGTPTDLSIIAREGEQAPGLPEGVLFDGSFSSPLLGYNDDLCFFANLRGEGVTSGNYYGLWKHGAEGTQLIVRVGDPAPGVEPLLPLFSVIDHSMSGSGCVVFRGKLTDFRIGIWSTDPCGIIHLIALTSTPLEISFGDIRVVESLEIAMGAGHGDGRPRSINEFPEIIFSADFTDGSEAILIARLPGSCRGDMNCDRSTNGSDIQSFVECMLGLRPYCAQADLNGDMSLTAVDVTLFIDRLLLESN